MVKFNRPALPAGRPPNCQHCGHPKNPKCACGRPFAITKETVKKLIEAFHDSFTIEDACKIARITKPTYYGELKRNPEFAYEMEMAQLWPERRARKNIVKQAAYDARIGLAYLERKRKEEWSPSFRAPPPELPDDDTPVSERTRELIERFGGTVIDGEATFTPIRTAE